MENQFVTYEIALKLKELGFDEPCFGYFPPLKKELTIWYNSEITNNGEFILVPLWQQAIDWFREIHGFYLEIQIGIEEYYFLFRDRKNSYGHELFCIEDKDYNIAREQAILKAIELCQKKK